jgi:SmpA / OmlA family
MKKKWLLVGIAALVVGGGVAVAIPALQPPGPGVTKANFDRIQDGMTRDEVEGILGEPVSSSIGRIPPGPNWFQWVTWKDQNREIVVAFRLRDEAGGATNKSFVDESFSARAWAYLARAMQK